MWPPSWPDIARADDAHVKWTVTVTDARGISAVRSFDAPANGEFYPIGDDSSASFHLTGATLQAEFRGSASETDTMSCSLSADRNTMRCAGTLTGPDGKTTKYVDVYARE